MMKSNVDKPEKLGKRLVKTHIIVGDDPWPIKVISHRRRVRKWPDGTYTYRSEGKEIPLKVVPENAVDAPFVEVVQIFGNRELFTGREHDNIDDLIRDWMSCDIDVTMFCAYLSERGWQQSDKKLPDIFLYENERFPLRQVRFPMNPSAHVDGAQALNDAVSKVAEIEGRELLGLRLELLSRADAAYRGKPS